MFIVELKELLTTMQREPQAWLAFDVMPTEKFLVMQPAVSHATITSRLDCGKASNFQLKHSRSCIDPAHQKLSNVHRTYLSKMDTALEFCGVETYGPGGHLLVSPGVYITTPNEIYGLPDQPGSCFAQRQVARILIRLNTPPAQTIPRTPFTPSMQIDALIKRYASKGMKIDDQNIALDYPKTNVRICGPIPIQS